MLADSDLDEPHNEIGGTAFVMHSTQIKGRLHDIESDTPNSGKSHQATANRVKRNHPALHLNLTPLSRLTVSWRQTFG